MKPVLRTLLICLLLGCSSLSLFAQQDSLMESYNRALPVEKIYLHFDRDQYQPGATVWYKAYLSSTMANPEAQSRSIYVDWYDGAGNRLAHHVHPVYRASASGNIEIPQTYRGSHVYAVAYTQWMLNFDSALLYRKALPIQLPSGIQPSLPASAGSIKLQCFPEGGALVNGLTSVLAFKLQGPDGLPMEGSGVIRNQRGQTITTWQTVHAGMGSVSFTPVSGDSYTASWTDAFGNDHVADIPAALAEGMVLTLKKGSLDRMFEINWTPGFAKRFDKLQIMLEADQHLLFQASGMITGNTTITGVLPLAKLPSGVLKLTVLGNQIPLAERILFVNNEEYRCDVSLVTDSVGLGRRQKNVYELVLPDSSDANISVSVTSGGTNTSSIISTLLLSSEIRGYIADPDYYFNSDEDSVKQQIDLVMLTQGWRRIKWESFFSRRYDETPYQHELEYMMVAGKIEDQSKGRLMSKAQSVNLFYQEKNSPWSFTTLPLGTGGVFEDHNRILFDSAYVFYQVNGAEVKGRTSVSVSNGLLPLQKGSQLDSLLPGLAFLRTRSGGINKAAAATEFGSANLGEVTVRTYTRTRLQEMNDTYTSGQFKFGDAYQLNIADDPTITASRNVLSYIQSKVAGLQVIPPFGSNPQVLWRGLNSINNITQVALFVNEIATTSSQVQMMSMLDVAYIKVFRPPFMGAPLGNGGVGAIAIYTKRGNDSKEKFDNMDHFVIAGYTPTKEFYEPDYQENAYRNNQQDNRTTLLWKPYLFTEPGSNKIRFQFYQNDLRKAIFVQVEGVTSSGKLIHFTQKIDE